METGEGGGDDWGSGEGWVERQKTVLEQPLKIGQKQKKEKKIKLSSG